MRGLAGKRIASRRGIEGKLEEYAKGKEYICYYRGFERWQQAFQSKKMEEHLCTQNFVYYQHHQRLRTLQKWKLETTLKILLRLKDLKAKKEFFGGWHQSASLVCSSRETRKISRVFSHWRETYRASVARHVINGNNGKTRRLLFVSWRTRSRKQQDGHARSIEFIGNSNLRYYLQKWRMEAAVHRYRGHRKPVNFDQPRYNRRPTLTLSRDQFRDLAPLNDTEFIV
ncbi:hypothetical protein PSACC_01934 [Paramicrosporidium saccamoebae]|uniref:Sfi1 spindle body domain-containing protein n=1 Tax=Paramicrosporidium saccamoebae TaxID=1246581 RepID=A0A2H9TKI0_9FUNG|nr:hypothetical protein PSACC_01934 [Paramicrosporidium saccamoebae]